MFHQKNIYAIRKSKLGVISARIAAVTLLFLAGGAVVDSTILSNSIVYADIIATESPTTETVIKSPVEYTADATKPVGTQEVKTQGTDGKLTLTTTDTGTKVELTKPTTTEVAVGTKPTVEVTIEDAAKTTYVADDTLEAGKTETITEAKDGQTTTNTTYKVVTTPKADLGKDVEAILNSDNYMYTDEQFYSVDNSKTLPSDKIVVDKLFLKVPEKQTLGEKTGIREIIQDAVFTPTEGAYAGKALTPEMMNPDDPEIRKLKEAYSYFWNDPEEKNSGYYTETWDYSKDKDFYQSAVLKNIWNINRLSLGAYVSDDLFHTTAPVSQEQAIKNYHAKHHITAAMYADAKASYLRMQQAVAKLKELGETDTVSGLQGQLDTVEEAFKSITQEYNTLHGYVDSFDPTYLGDDIPDSFKQNTKEDITKLPFEIRKNLVNLTVSSANLPSAAQTNTPEGVADYVEKRIRLKFNAEKDRWFLGADGKPYSVKQVPSRDQRRLLLIHELGHIIDFNSGLGNLGNTSTIRAYFDGAGFNYAGLSTSTEFREAYEKYMKPNRQIDAYFSQNPEEAFAEGFGQYVNKRVFGVPFDHYKNYYTILPGEEGYEEATTPYDQMEYYFASLYNKLFEQPVEANAVLDTVQTTSQARQDGLVKVGTKATEEKTTVAFTTTEQEDASLEAGIRKVVQIGKNGENLTVTKYTLNTETGQLTASTEETVVSAMIPEVVLVGTKQKNEQQPTLPTPTTKETTPEVHKQNEPENQLPNTGSHSELGLTLLGYLGFLSGLVVLKRKK